LRAIGACLLLDDQGETKVLCTLPAYTPQVGGVAA